jgi:hypothetical protein
MDCGDGNATGKHSTWEGIDQQQDPEVATLYVMQLAIWSYTALSK